MTKKTTIDKRDQWWGYPDPMPAVLKALEADDLRAEFLARVDSAEDLDDWLNSRHDPAVPEEACKLIRKHINSEEGFSFDEVEVSSESCDVGLGVTKTLFARRRKSMIEYRVHSSEFGDDDPPAPTKEPLSPREVARLLGPDLDHDWSEEAGEIVDSLGPEPSDEDLETAVDEYASHHGNSVEIAEKLLDRAREILSRDGDAIK